MTSFGIKLKAYDSRKAVALQQAGFRRMIKQCYVNLMFDSSSFIPPSQGSSLAAALAWIAGMLTGTVGTIIGALAFTALGFAMLQGRLPFKVGARVTVGGFILFGAAQVAATLTSLAIGPRSAFLNEPPAAQSNVVLPLNETPKQNLYEKPGFTIP